MKRRILTHALVAWAAYMGTSHAATGPTLSPLKVTSMYLNSSSSLYVSFQSGAMPGCYTNSGGYLFTSNPAYKEIYALLLTMTAGTAIRAAVLYTQNTPTNNWVDCTIEGIYVLP